MYIYLYICTYICIYICSFPVSVYPVSLSRIAVEVWCIFLFLQLHFDFSHLLHSKLQKIVVRLIHEYGKKQYHNELQDTKFD